MRAEYEQAHLDAKSEAEQGLQCANERMLRANRIEMNGDVVPIEVRVATRLPKQCFERRSELVLLVEQSRRQLGVELEQAEQAGEQATAFIAQAASFRSGDIEDSGSASQDGTEDLVKSIKLRIAGRP